MDIGSPTWARTRDLRINSRGHRESRVHREMPEATLSVGYLFSTPPGIFGFLRASVPSLSRAGEAQETVTWPWRECPYAFLIEIEIGGVVTSAVIA